MKSINKKNPHVKAYPLRRVVLAAAVSLAVHPAMAANINVTAGAVDIVSNGNCSIREAIAAANFDSMVDACPTGLGPDNIILPAGSTFTLTAVNINGPNGPNGLPVVTGEITIQGNGSIIERSAAGGTPNFRIFEVSINGDLTIDRTTLRNGLLGTDPGAGLYNDRGTVTITNSTVSGNTSADEGGGLHNGQGTSMITVTNSTISGNSAVRGGGLYNDNGAVIVTNSTISGNSASLYGGGLNSGESGPVTITGSTISGNTAGEDGGGLYNTDGTMTITNSTISGNSAGSDGGGLYNEAGTTNVTNSTISGNSTTLNGGGLSTGNGAVTTITNSTVSNNDAGGDGDGLNIFGGTVNVINTIVANGAGNDCRAFITDNGNNWFEDTTCNGVADGDPMLAPLGNFGGPTQTQALLPGAGPIDGGDNATCMAMLVNDLDQRGETRPGDVVGDVTCDIGAFERQSNDTTGIPLLNPMGLLTLILGLLGLGGFAKRRQQRNG